MVDDNMRSLFDGEEIAVNVEKHKRTERMLNTVSITPPVHVYRSASCNSDT